MLLTRFFDAKRVPVSNEERQAMSKDAPANVYPLLATRSDIVMPGEVVPLEVGRKSSLRAIDAAKKDGSEIILCAQKDAEVENPSSHDLLSVGVKAEITQVNKHSPNHYTVIVRAVQRVTLTGLWQTEPYLIATCEPFVSVPAPKGQSTDDILTRIRGALIAILAEDAEDIENLRDSLEDIKDPDGLVDLAIAHVEFERDDLIKLLCEPNADKRLRAVLPDIERLGEVLKMKNDIKGQILDDDSKRHKEQVLRARMRSIKEELGESDDDSELDELKTKIDEGGLSAEASKAANKQLRRMRDMQTGSAEYNVALNYVQWLLDLPWIKETEDTLDVSAARAILEADHAGLEKVKKRILEFIAVRKLAPHKQGPILCLAGPPGVGKTSLGRSIATALGREYVRIALGGVRDDSEIRGHRRTYVGALPGRIVTGLKKAGTVNPVFVLDEIDKMSSGSRGDPASAMLEVLDPEQNAEFSDHYIEIPVDLSKVMFLATANSLETIPGPLLDRMEIIQLPGYTSEEKMTIARNYLVPRQTGEHGMNKDQLTITDDALRSLIDNYTRESGVRNLEREVATLCRSAAVEVAGGKEEKQTINFDRVTEILGPIKFKPETADRKPQVGVSTGLAWTPVGGDILFIEARAMPGRGELKLTGQLGDVMTESVRCALSWIRSNSETLGVDDSKIDTIDLHMHLPSGAIKKDGPSAGVAIAAALSSILSNKPIRHDVACTGEITLRGHVLPVGGIKSKVLAAHRAGIKIILLPERNKKDIIDIPESVRNDLDIRVVSRAIDAFKVLFSDPSVELPKPPPQSKKPKSTQASGANQA